jgi:uncharacterized protein (UPF0548 family)
MWSLFRPSDHSTQTFVSRAIQLPFSYPEIGASRGDFPAGYHHDFHRVQVGRGEKAFEAACSGLRKWQMFPKPWTYIIPADAPIEIDVVVAVVARAMGVWWLNACRIVYVIDETEPVRRFGFAYGTVDHAECGEERFTVEWLADDSVWYDVRAFSRPHHWTARLGAPVARRLQRKFARESMAAMQNFVSASA